MPRTFRPKYTEEKDSCDEYLKRFIQRLKYARQMGLLLPLSKNLRKGTTNEFAEMSASVIDANFSNSC